MYPIERLRDIRELELYLFGGVPEVPEPMYERDVYDHADVRLTRSSVVGYGGRESEQDVVVGYMEVNIETGEIYFKEFEESAN